MKSLRLTGYFFNPATAFDVIRLAVMQAAGLFDGVKAEQAVGDHNGVREQRIRGPLLDGGRAKAGDDRELDGAGLVAVGGLDGGDKGGLARRSAADLAARALAAEVGIVELDKARERLVGIALELGLHEFVLHALGGVERDADAAAEFERRDAICMRSQPLLAKALTKLQISTLHMEICQPIEISSFLSILQFMMKLYFQCFGLQQPIHLTL